jgi:Glycosyltransferase 61
MDIKYILCKLGSLHGTITHYYHFFFGVLVPLILKYIELQNKYQHITFIIDNSLGPMLKILLQIPIDIKLKTDLPNINELDIEKLYLTPMDVAPYKDKRDINWIDKGWAKKLTFDNVIEIKNFIKNNNHSLFNEKYDIVIIERKMDKSFKSTYFKEDGKKYDYLITTSGSERRNIINHDEIVESVKNKFKDKTVINISLEYLPFFEQYQLFSNAKIIIAQHGASLSNIIFMNEKSIIVEIISEYKLNEDWFGELSKICKIQKHYQLITKDEHALIDIKKFDEILDEIKL